MIVVYAPLPSLGAPKCSLSPHCTSLCTPGTRLLVLCMPLFSVCKHMCLLCSPLRSVCWFVCSLFVFVCSLAGGGGGCVYQTYKRRIRQICLLGVLVGWLVGWCVGGFGLLMSCIAQYSNGIQKPTVQAASEKLNARLVSSATPHHTPRNEARGAHRRIECQFAIVRGATRPRYGRCQATQAACGLVTTSMWWHNAIPAPANGFVCYCLGTGRVTGRV